MEYFLPLSSCTNCDVCVGAGLVNSSLTGPTFAVGGFSFKMFC